MTTPRIGDRALFPDLAARSYLAHCAISPVSTPVRTAVDAVTASYARAGVGALGQWMEQRARLRQALGALIGATGDDIGLVANTTTGIVDIAFSLPWRAGDRVVVFDGEFPANVTPWVQAARTFGAEVVRVGSQLIVVECKVRDEEDHVIASADFSMMIVTLRRPLAPGIESEPGDPEL